MPNRKQQAVIAAMRNHTEFWRGCGDIDSPSHYIDIEDSRELLLDDHGLDKHEAEEFATRLVDILNYIRDL